MKDTTGTGFPRSTAPATESAARATNQKHRQRVRRRDRRRCAASMRARMGRNTAGLPRSGYQIPPPQSADPPLARAIKDHRPAICTRIKSKPVSFWSSRIHMFDGQFDCMVAHQQVQGRRQHETLETSGSSSPFKKYRLVSKERAAPRNCHNAKRCDSTVEATGHRSTQAICKTGPGAIVATRTANPDETQESTLKTSFDC